MIEDTTARTAAVETSTAVTPLAQRHAKDTGANDRTQRTGGGPASDQLERAKTC
jgi:hypothetical protein